MTRWRADDPRRAQLVARNRLGWKSDDPRRAQLAERNRSTSQRRAVSSALTGRVYSASHVEKIRQARLGRRAPLWLRQKLSRMRKGHPVSTATRKRQSDSNKLTWSQPALKERQREITNGLIESGHIKIPRPVWRNTQLEARLLKFLVASGFCVLREKQFGRFRVDFYLPDYHLAFEADGEYWHQIVEENRPGYYANRDAILLERFGLPVVRMPQNEIESLVREGV